MENLTPKINPVERSGTSARIVRASSMRWDELFDDLESQLELELTAEELDLQLEEERLRLARLGIRDRLRALSGIAEPGGFGLDDHTLHLVLADGSRVSVAPSSFGRDWIAGELLEESERHRQCIVPMDAIVAIVLDLSQVEPSLQRMAEESTGALSARLGLPFVLRDLCRRRASVQLRLTTARLYGTMDRVGRDHLDIAVHEPDEPRRDSVVREYRIVRLSELVLVLF